jgi:hypothetical protein
MQGVIMPRKTQDYWIKFELVNAEFYLGDLDKLGGHKKNWWFKMPLYLFDGYTNGTLAVQIGIFVILGRYSKRTGQVHCESALGTLFKDSGVPRKTILKVLSNLEHSGLIKYDVRPLEEKRKEESRIEKITISSFIEKTPPRENQQNYQEPPPPSKDRLQEIQRQQEAWFDVQRHFMIDPPFLLPGDEIHLDRLVKENGLEMVLDAMDGMKKQKKGKDYDPANCVNINFLRKNFSNLVALGRKKLRPNTEQLWELKDETTKPRI